MISLKSAILVSVLCRMVGLSGGVYLMFDRPLMLCAFFLMVLLLV